MRPVDAPVDPVLEGDLERLLDRHRAVGGEEEVGVVDRAPPAARASASSTTTVLPLPSMVRVGDLARLGGQRGVELGDAVAERVDPEGGDRIEVAAPVDVDQLAPSARSMTSGALSA